MGKIVEEKKKIRLLNCIISFRKKFSTADNKRFVVYSGTVRNVAKSKKNYNKLPGKHLSAHGEQIKRWVLKPQSGQYENTLTAMYKNFR